MKKRYLYITATILSTTLLLTGCGNGNRNESLHNTHANAMISNSVIYESESDYGTYEWVSPDGVHYWVVIGNNRYGITPRYDNKGNLVIDEIN